MAWASTFIFVALAFLAMGSQWSAGLKPSTKKLVSEIKEEQLSPKAPAAGAIVHVQPPARSIIRGVTAQPSKWVERYRSIRLRASWSERIIAVVDRIQRDLVRYEIAEGQTGVPWYVIACLHNMEASGSFDKHLHNGNPLTKRTYWVPKGRLVDKDPPYTWEESAADALAYDKLTLITSWELHHLLYTLERYNGLGYVRWHPDVPSPYLWSGSFHYTRGKYIADGKWSSTAVSQQVGCASILREMEIRGMVKILYKE